MAPESLGKLPVGLYVSWPFKTLPRLLRVEIVPPPDTRAAEKSITYQSEISYTTVNPPI